MLPIRVGGRAVAGRGAALVVTEKYREQPWKTVGTADAAQVGEAVAAAAAAFAPMQAAPLHARRRALERASAGVEAARARFREALIAEAGKPWKDAEAEVTRAVDTFALAAAETARSMGGGEMLRMDETPRGDGCTALVRRVGRGPIAMVAPFNFPLNLVAHKVAPALAAGCPFVLKPSDRTPVSALLLADVLEDALDGLLPREAVSVVPCAVDAAALLVDDPRLKVLSFTGSPGVGWALARRAGGKRLVLELGGNAACVVAPDADVNAAAARIAFGAFYYSGQTCISVQRVVVHESLYGALRDRLIAEAAALRIGDPASRDTFIGPMIARSEVDRVHRAVSDAVARGATVLTGGRPDGIFYPPTVIENVDPALPLSCEEIFGPVCVLYRYKELDEAIALVNHGSFGLQAGVFTRDIAAAFRLWRHVDAGGLVVNDVPTVRCDAQPYGGNKASGIGREGPRYAIEEYTERRVMMLQKIDVD
jgi:acyl-CoA reductase-like NAD-dependent aldehyde dehydrogenase